MIVSMEAASDKYCCADVTTSCWVEDCMAWNFATYEDANPQTRCTVYDPDDSKLSSDLREEYEKAEAARYDVVVTQEGTIVDNLVESQKLLQSINDKFEELRNTSEAQLSSWTPPEPAQQEGWQLLRVGVQDDGAPYGARYAVWERAKTKAERFGFCGLAHTQK